MLRRLFGGGGAGPGAAAPEPDRSNAIEYKGFTILPTPRPHGGQFLTAARIEKAGEGGATRVHELVRADTHSSPDEAASFAVSKAKRVIDEQGERLFG